ncbi:hypothetical protein ACF0H5_015314 [Mactra antiquata]
MSNKYLWSPFAKDIVTQQTALSDATCGDAVQEKEECTNIVNAMCDNSTGTQVCTCMAGIQEDSGTCPLGLEKACTGLECTTEHAECNADDICACKSDYKPNDEKSACVQKSVNDYTCTDTDVSNCPENAVCAEDKCKCDDGYEENGNQCAEKALDDSCNEDSECIDVDYAVCTGSKCTCDTGYAPNSGACNQVVTGVSCSSPEDCTSIDNAMCSDGSTPICVCKVKSTENSGVCELGLDGTCTDLKCTTEYAACNNDDKCACNSAYKPNDGNTACVPKDVTHTVCSGDGKCSCDTDTPNKGACNKGMLQIFVWWTIGV